MYNCKRVFVISDQFYIVLLHLFPSIKDSNGLNSFMKIILDVSLPIINLLNFKSTSIKCSKDIIIYFRLNAALKTRTDIGINCQFLFNFLL